MDHIVDLSDAEMGMLWQLASSMLTDYNHNMPDAFAAAVKQRAKLTAACRGSGMPAGETPEGKVYVCHKDGRWSLRVVPFD